MALSFQDFRFSSLELQQWIIQQGNELTDNLACFLAGLIEKGEIRDVHTTVASTMVLDMLRISFFYKMTNHQENIEDILDAKIDILRRGLLK